MRDQVGHFKQVFCENLRRIGLECSLDEADSLLLPVQDDLLSVAAVITHVAELTTQLEHLVEYSREDPTHSKRYYGMYVLLVYAIDRIQTRFVSEVDTTYLPKLQRFEQYARANIADANKQISGGGPQEQLMANVEASETTIHASQFLADALRKQRITIEKERDNTRKMLAAAKNTYKTVRLSQNMAQIINDCQGAFRALRELQVPRLRPFQNLQLKEELRRLSENM
jgi:hypothetical protein